MKINMPRYPFPHKLLGANIIGKPGIQQVQTIKGLGAVSQYNMTWIRPIRYPYYPVTTYPYYQYPTQYYPPQPQYYPGVPYSACVGSGGMWDSFANSCTTAAGQTLTYNPYLYQDLQWPYGPYTQFVEQPSQPLPSVVGMSMGSGVAALNQAGYAVWLLYKDGVAQGNPPGYNPSRAVIITNNGIITSMYQG